MVVAAPLILLVEDSVDDVELTMRAFRRYDPDVEVVVVGDGEEALEFLFAEGEYAGRDPQVMPDLVLLDLNLPKLGGVEVLQRIRSDARTRFLPVVVLTTSAEPTDLDSCYSCGANSYVRKPVDYSDFEELINVVGAYWLRLNMRAGQQA